MTEPTYLDLDLMLVRSGNGYQARVLRSPAGDGQVATFSKPVSDLELENFVLKMGRTRVRTRRIQAAPVVAAKELGGRLFTAVFSGAVRDCLHRSVDYARNENLPLRIRLTIGDCPELANLPWEFLYDRDDDWFLALSGSTPLVRYIQMPVQPRAVHIALPLRVLVIRSEPVDCPELDLAAEWAQVAEALDDLTQAGSLSFTELAIPTLSELRRALLRDTFHVLHYMGHGGFTQQDGGVLLFTDRAGVSVPVTAENLGVILRDHTSLRLAVLNACEAGRTDPADPFGGVADTLVRRGIPAVIAMQFEVSDQAAIEFAPALYGALVAGRPVDVAVAEARKAIYAVSPLEWATPVLYLRASDARLFDVSPRETDTPLGRLRAADNVTIARNYADEGDNLHDRERYIEAVAAYQRAITLDPGLARAYSRLSECLYQLKRFPEGEASAREAVRLDPGNARAHGILGVTLAAEERYAEGEAACREAIRIDPANAKVARVGLCTILAARQRFFEAINEFVKSLQFGPADASQCEFYIKLLKEIGKQKNAQIDAQDYEKAAALRDAELQLLKNGHGNLLEAVRREKEAAIVAGDIAESQDLQNIEAQIVKRISLCDSPIGIGLR